MKKVQEKESVMVSIPSLNYNGAMASVIDFRTNSIPKFQMLADKYADEGNVEQQKRYEDAIVKAEDELIPFYQKQAEHWARIAGIPEGKVGQILTPEEVKFYEKDRSGGVTGFPESLFPKGFGLDQYA